MNLDEGHTARARTACARPLDPRRPAARLARLAAVGVVAVVVARLGGCGNDATSGPARMPPERAVGDVTALLSGTAIIDAQ